jgi:NIMA (never in mitosis gene a)-related kinase
MSRVNERIGSALARNGYEQVRTVGEGSYGKAVLVRHTTPSPRDSQSKAVVKMIDISRASKKEREEALRESQVLASLKHPYIVKYRSNFLADGMLCIVMDYCEGGDLKSRIKKTKQNGKSFSERQVLWWFSQGVLALEYIHDMHILHRDLKSGNFFLSKNDNMKLGDFGIAKVLECTAACAQTQIGTPLYLCPEICKGKSYAWGSDIWAMGCILYEMCTGQPPFNGQDFNNLIEKILRGTTPDLPDEYSRALNDVLKTLLNRKVECRPKASDILQLPLIRSTVKKMVFPSREERMEHKPSRSEACSEEKRPRSSVASSVPSARPFSKRDVVEYHSETHGEWLQAIVTSVNEKGEILLDIKPNAWISLDLQAKKVRLFKTRASPDSKAPSRHPSNAGPPGHARRCGPGDGCYERRRASVPEQGAGAQRQMAERQAGYGHEKPPVADMRRRPPPRCHEVGVLVRAPQN